MLGVLATVALCATVSQVPALQWGPVILLQDLQQSGPPITMGKPFSSGERDLSAGVEGLSTVRRKLSSTLKPLREFKRNKPAPPPAAKVACTITALHRPPPPCSPSPPASAAAATTSAIRYSQLNGQVVSDALLRIS